MNAERILKLADVIERTPHRKEQPVTRGRKHLAGFNMANWHCGTVGCIAGWAAQTFDCGLGDAAEALGLDCVDGDALFIGHGVKMDLAAVTPAQAAIVLRHLASTGRVDWSVAL